MPLNFIKNRVFFRKKAALEVFRITLCLIFPLSTALIYANPKVMNDIITYMRLVEYPEAAPPPPVGEEITPYRSKKFRD